MARQRGTETGVINLGPSLGGQQEQVLPFLCTKLLVLEFPSSWSSGPNWTLNFTNILHLCPGTQACRGLCQGGSPGIAPAMITPLLCALGEKRMPVVSYTSTLPRLLFLKFQRRRRSTSMGGEGGSSWITAGTGRERAHSSDPGPSSAYN